MSDQINILGSPNASSPWVNTTKPVDTTGLSASLMTILFSHSYFLDSAKLLIAGSFIETGRRLCQWLMERFRIQYSITAQFDEGDPAYEWIVLFLTEEKVWRRSRDFRVSSKTSLRKWGVETNSRSLIEGHAEYVPTYDYPQLFRFKRYWVEIKRSKSTQGFNPMFGPPGPSSSLYLTMYTLDMSAISALVEEARRRYIESSKPNIIIHSVDAPNFGPVFTWNNVKRKLRRPLSSIILQSGVLESLLKDTQEFLEMEEWYAESGIPHRRGYLLFGPPGTGKTSTIYALAGELGLEIYSLSLAAGFVDDSFLQRAASSTPKMSIFLIEDIDCAFPSREDEEKNAQSPYPLPGMPYPMNRRSAVTLSGLLNVIDGIGSEEGKLFFATTNCVDRLDHALLRPGRIDVKIQYNLATREQTHALFVRFFPESRFGRHAKVDDPAPSEPPSPADISEKVAFTKAESDPECDLDLDIPSLANTFSGRVPEDEFSTAELQGYLLMHKKQPLRAVEGVDTWIEEERRARKEREEREKEKKNAIKAKGQLEIDNRALLSAPVPALNGFVGQMSVLTPLPGQSVAGVRPVPVDVVEAPLQGNANVINGVTNSDGQDINKESTTPSSSPSLISLSDQDGD